MLIEIVFRREKNEIEIKEKQKCHDRREKLLSQLNAVYLINIIYTD